MSSQSNKAKYKKMDAMIAKLQLFGTQAAPAYNTTQRLTRASMQFLSDKFDNREEMLSFDLTTEDLINRICHLRHDHTTLESILTIVDNFLGVNGLTVFKAKLGAQLSDEELRKITLNSKENTVNYIRSTIPVDVLISHLEGRAIFKDGRSVEEFSNSILSLFHEVYPANKRQLIA